MSKVFGSRLGNGLCRRLEGFSTGPDVEDVGEGTGRTGLQEHGGAAVDIQGLWQEQGCRSNHKTSTEGSWASSLAFSSVTPFPSAITVPPPVQQGCPRDAVCT